MRIDIEFGDGFWIWIPNVEYWLLNILTTVLQWGYDINDRYRGFEDDFVILFLKGILDLNICLTVSLNGDTDLDDEMMTGCQTEKIING